MIQKDRSGLSLFIDHYCLRCSNPFLPGETAVTVVAKDGNFPIGLQVHFLCATGGIDRIVGDGKAIASDFVPMPRSWPFYIGSIKIAAYARMVRLSNGVYRLGLIHAFPELWNLKMIQAHPINVINGYDNNYLYFGPVAKNASLIHRVIETRFQDLQQPIEYANMPLSFQQVF